MTGPATVRVLGVRHHGPGSAGSVRTALQQFSPDVVLIEGPADADPLVEFVADPAMVPPVALLGYVPDAPDRAVFWPFATFSPEWQAMTWAVANDVPVRFMDLPVAAVLARGDVREERSAERADPIGTLARTAGQDDPERWWEDLVESRGEHADAVGGADDVFEALTEAMGALREGNPAVGNEARREAHMRTVLRKALRQGHERIAVVCGAWHAPVLAGKLPTATSDTALLKGLPRQKAVLTWVPWTHGRLAADSGYGAGITSPGWYHHLFSAPDRPVTRWLTAVARVLREDDLPVSAAHVIEAVRLAETLATLRGRPLAGLDEVTEATRAVLCQGDDLLLDVVTRRLVVGELLGEVPDGVPTLPLDADLRAHQRRLRLKPDAAVRELSLDLRNPRELERSLLLHRLVLLDVRWGRPAESAVRSTGTFRETWELQWRPELSVDLAVASRWGTTVRSAAANRLEDLARDGTLAAVTAAVETALRADLPAALPSLLAALDARAAAESDVAHLMATIGPLVRALRYGDVRGTGTRSLSAVAVALVGRVCAGLPAAVGSLDDDAAATVQRRVDEVHAALALFGRDDLDREWTGVLRKVADRPGVHPLLVGRTVRLLRDNGSLTGQDTADRLSRALSGAVPPAAQGAWVEGFLAGGGLLLVHDPELLAVLDGWVAGLSGPEFLDVLPLVRRTFSTFGTGERRSIGDSVAGGGRRPTTHDEFFDVGRAERAATTVLDLLGVSR